MGTPGAPRIWLLWRLHFIPFAELIDPNPQPLQKRGGTEPKEVDRGKQSGSGSKELPEGHTEEPMEEMSGNVKKL